MTIEYRVVPVELLNRLIKSMRPYPEDFDGELELTDLLASPVPPAGAEPMKIVQNYDGRQLTDIFHVTRLQAEVTSLKSWQEDVRNGSELLRRLDAMQSELAKSVTEVKRYKNMSDNYCALGMDANIELAKARELLAQYQCRHEWIDNGDDLLVCPKCGKEDSDPEPFGWVQTSGPNINCFTQEWDVVEEWSANGYEWAELFTGDAHQSAPAAKDGSDE